MSKPFLTRLSCDVLVLECGLVGTLLYHKIGPIFSLSCPFYISYCRLNPLRFRHGDIFLPISNFYFAIQTQFLHSQMSIITIKLPKFISFLSLSFILLLLLLSINLFFHEPWSPILSTNIINQHLVLIKTFTEIFNSNLVVKVFYRQIQTFRHHSFILFTILHLS